ALLAASDACEPSSATAPQKTTVVVKDLSRFAGNRSIGERLVKSQLPSWLVSALRRPSFTSPLPNTLHCVWLI
ncbi:MAG: hypothetical protein AB7K24_30240, partial [Gemmataceae bacterium]